MSDRSETTVSVIIPAYNAAPYLAEAISSALAQSFDGLEIIVVDDGSTDATPCVIESFGDRVRSVRQENGGVAEALNKGISLARGRYVSLLAADDLLCEGAIATRVKLLDEDPDAGFVHAAAYEIDERGDILRTRVRSGAPVVTQHPREAVIDLLRRNTVVCSSVMIRKSCLDEVGGFYQECMPGEDWHMWLRLAARYNVIYTRSILAKYRIHGRSLSSEFQLDSYEAAHLRTLKSLYEEGQIGEHRDLEAYAYASHLRTVALQAAYLRKPFTSWRYLSRAIVKRPALLLEHHTWFTLFEGAKAILPPRAIRFGGAVKERLRGKPADLTESKKPAS